MFVLQVLSIWYIHSDGTKIWNEVRKVLKWKASKCSSLCSTFIMHNETFALKVWKLNRFHTVYHYSFFLFFFSLFLLKAFSFLCLFPSLLVNFFVICSNILHSASLLGNLQLILTIMKVMKTVTGSFCSLPGPVLAALHTLPPLKGGMRYAPLHRWGKQESETK